MIQNGSRVTIHYTLTVDGETVESTRGGAPLSYVHGRDEVFPGLEERLAGSRPGDTLRFALPPERAYGAPDPEAVQTLLKSILDLPPDLRPGQIVSGTLAGDPFCARIVAIGDRDITLDLNHPLAGKNLHFDVEIVAVAD